MADAKRQTAALGALDKQNTELQEKYTQLLNEVNVLRQDNAACRADVETARLEAATLSNEKKEMEMSLKSLMNDDKAALLARLTKENSTLQSQVQELSRNLGGHQSESEEGLRRDVERFAEENKKQQAEIEKLRDRLTSAESIVKRGTTRGPVITAGQANPSQQLEEKLKERETQIATLQKTLTTDSATLQTQSAQLEEMRKDRNSKDQQVNNLTEELKQTKAQLASITESRSREVASLSQQRASLQSELDQTSKDLKDANTRLQSDTKATEITRLEKVKSGLEAKVAELSTNLTQSQQTGDKQRDEMAQLRTQADKAHLLAQDKANLKQEMLDRERFMTQLEQSVADEQRRSADIKDQLKTAQLMNQDIPALKAEIGRLRSENSSLASSAGADAQKQAQRSVELEKQAEQLKSRLHGLESQVDGLNKDKAALQNSSNQANEKVQVLEAQLKKAASTPVPTSPTSAGSSEDVANLQAANKKLEAKIKKLEKDRIVLEETIEKMTQEMAEMEAEQGGADGTE
jgi:chromosome segregation ATPase